MAKQKYTIELTGKGALSNPEILLESDIPVPMESSDNEAWTGEMELNVIGDLDYQMTCYAISGTKWEFKITNDDSGNAVVSLSGKTGEKFHNKSRRFGSTNPQ